MTDLSKPDLRQVLNQTVNEGQHGEFSDSDLPVLMIVLETKGHVALSELDNAPFGNHGPLGITAGVTDGLVGTFQRRTDEDMPALLANVPQELVHLDPASGVASKPATHQGLGLVSAAHSVEDVQLPLRSQQGGRDEIALGGGLPAIAGAVEPSGGDDHMEMGVPFEVGPEGVQDDDQAWQVAPAWTSGRQPGLALAPSWGGSLPAETQDSIRGGSKQHVEQDPTVVLDHQPQLPRQGEDQVPIGHLQEIREELVAPLVGADLPAAGTEDRFAAVGYDLDGRTVGAPKQMQPQFRGPARQHPGDMVVDCPPHLSPFPGDVALEVVARQEDLRDGDRTAPPAHGQRCSSPPASVSSSLPFRPRLPRPKTTFYGQGPSARSAYSKRGEYASPGRLVGPGVPSALTDGRTPFEVKPPWPGSKKTGRRLALAKWLVKPDNPLTARVMVNRIWRYHFGRGIVETLGNFGRSGARPTHPDLLDWLAVEFVKRGWSVKAMHRLMMTSRTYRQSSRVRPEHDRLDPENRLLSRWPLRRMDGEALRDSLLWVSGRLDESQYGPPDPIFVRVNGLSTAYRRDTGWRRSIYLRQPRFNSSTTLDLFDYPQMSPNCVDRAQSTVAPQALHLLNDSTIRQLADSVAERVRMEVGENLADQIERVYWVTLSRPPTGEERQISLESFQAASEALTDRDDHRLQVLAKFCHTLFNSAAFVYID